MPLIALTRLIESLEDTSSRLAKERLIDQFLANESPSDINDMYTMFECLAGEHPIGFTFTPSAPQEPSAFQSLSQAVAFLTSLPDHSLVTIVDAQRRVGSMGPFLAPIVNRELRLGITLQRPGARVYRPMLAKAFSPAEELRRPLVITEKLDGNRCMAMFDATNHVWRFISRNGKPMRVNFDMGGLDESLVYDGEVLSREQTRLSEQRAEYILTHSSEILAPTKSFGMFASTSGVINSKAKDKDLVYNIFDVVLSIPYADRRKMLAEMRPLSSSVRILPVLSVTSDQSLIDKLLLTVTKSGGEGLMLNDPTVRYQMKRTEALLKYKQVRTIDMMVYATCEGSGKYSGMVGSLEADIFTESGAHILARVGSGLSDEQRLLWAMRPEQIVGKVIRVGYQDITTNANGTNSLRFPRLLSIKEVNETSEY